MKCVISAADYGMTEGITDGCIRAIRDGLLMDVGLMTNNYIHDRGEILENEYTLLRMHIGYPDAELYRMSTLHDVRSIEASALCDPRFKRWVEENHVEVISYAQFFEERPFHWDT